MNPTAHGNLCPHCDGIGEVPTADTAHLAGTTVGGFEHPNLRFDRCHVCDGSGYIVTTTAGGAA